MSETAPADPRFASVGCVFFVIGAQKAGTTWLSWYLRDHPNVSVPHWKEHNYWNMVEGRPDPGRGLLEQKRRRQNEKLHRKLASHLWFTLHARRQRAITLALKAAEAPGAPHSAYADAILENVNSKTAAAGEICPQYTFLSPRTYAEMSGLGPNVKFIMLMRDPVSRFISGASHSLRKSGQAGEVTTETLSETIHRFVENDDSHALERSRYHKTIENLEQEVPASQIAYGFFEHLFDQSEVKRFCDFLGIPFVPGKIERRRNDAGKQRVEVSDQDRAMIAQKLKPVYDYVINRFGDDVPSKWIKSAALCGSAAEMAGARG